MFTLLKSKKTMWWLSALCLTFLLMFTFTPLLASGFIPDNPDSPVPVAVVTYLIPLLATIMNLIWPLLNRKRLIECLHDVWNIILEVDKLFDEANNHRVITALNETKGGINRAKKLITCERLDMLPTKSKDPILKHFKSFDWAVEAAFLFFKFGKRITDIIK